MSQFFFDVEDNGKASLRRDLNSWLRHKLADMKTAGHISRWSCDAKSSQDNLTVAILAK